MNVLSIQIFVHMTDGSEPAIHLSLMYDTYNPFKLSYSSRAPVILIKKLDYEQKLLHLINLQRALYV